MIFTAMCYLGAPDLGEAATLITQNLFTAFIQNLSLVLSAVAFTRQMECTAAVL